MASLEEIFEEEERMKEREAIVRQREHEIESGMSISELRHFRTNRHLMVYCPEAGDPISYADFRLARECEQRGEYPSSLDDYEAELEEKRRRNSFYADNEPETISDYRRQRGQE
jgi:hypothetical protein